METKRCPRCDTARPVEDFGVNRSHRTGRQTYCKQCTQGYRRERYVADPEVQRERSRLWRAENPEKYREAKRASYVKQPAYYLGKWFNLTLDDYERMLAEQGGKCANRACDRASSAGHRFHVDHDHACCPGRASCGKCVRGLLCSSCNQALGNVRDDLAKLHGLVDYLERGRAV